MPRLVAGGFLLCTTILLGLTHSYANTISPLFANPEITTTDDQTTVIVNDAPDQEVIVIGKSVIVNKNAKGVLAVGGDVIVEGRVEGDVATVGGNVIQKKDAYIGGDIIVFGGSYKPESETPLRAPNKETVMLGVFEDELRSFGQNPSEIFTTSFSVSFVAQRLLLALFWFVVSIAFTTIAPGAVSRAVARINLSFVKITAIGAGSFMVVSGLIVAGAISLPDYLGVMLGILGTFLLVLGYVFGRVALQVTVGKAIQKHFLSERKRSETLAILIGTMTWTLLLSLPYLWVMALFLVFAVGIGLVLTGRPVPKWQHP